METQFNSSRKYWHISHLHLYNLGYETISNILSDKIDIYSLTAVEFNLSVQTSVTYTISIYFQLQKTHLLYHVWTMFILYTARGQAVLRWRRVRVPGRRARSCRARPCFMGTSSMEEWRHGGRVPTRSSIRLSEHNTPSSRCNYVCRSINNK